MSYRIKIDENENLDVLKFGMSIDIIDTFCCGDCELFAYILKQKIGGDIYVVNKDYHYILLYKGYFIDIYGIQTLEALGNRKLPTADTKRKFSLNKTYNEVNGGKMNLEKVEINLTFGTPKDYYTPFQTDHTEFIIDLILKSDTFKSFDVKLSLEDEPFFDLLGF